MQPQPPWVHPSTVGTLTRSRRVVLLLSLLLWLMHPLDTKLRCLALSLGYSFIEYNFTYFERGKAYTSMAQFVANVLYMPLLVDLYSHFLWRFPFLYMSLFPMNIWLLEIVQGLAIQWIYGRNVAWCYADYADELFNGLIRIGHAIWWWGLGVALWLFYPFIQRASLHLAQLGSWDDPHQGHQLSTYCPCWSRRWGCTKLVAQLVNDDSPRVTAVIELVRRSWRRLWCENLWLWAMACRPAKGWTSWRKRKHFGPIVIHFSVTCLWRTCRHMCPCLYMFCRVSEFLVESNLTSLNQFSIFTFPPFRQWFAAGLTCLRLWWELWSSPPGWWVKGWKRSSWIGDCAYIFVLSIAPFMFLDAKSKRLIVHCQCICCLQFLDIACRFITIWQGIRSFGKDLVCHIAIGFCYGRYYVTGPVLAVHQLPRIVSCGAQSRNVHRGYKGAIGLRLPNFSEYYIYDIWYMVYDVWHMSM